MKQQEIKGEGVLGMRLELTTCDMFAISSVADEMVKVMCNHTDIKAYDTCPYDERGEKFPEGRPNRIELSDDTARLIMNFLLRLSYEAKSNVFEPTENMFKKTEKTDLPF